MKAPITDKHLLEMMWERFPEIMKRGIEQPAQQKPVKVKTCDTCQFGERCNQWSCKNHSLWKPLQPARSKPLTDAQINAFFEGMEPNNGFWLSFARAIEAAHGIKENT